MSEVLEAGAILSSVDEPPRLHPQSREPLRPRDFADELLAEASADAREQQQHARRAYDGPDRAMIARDDDFPSWSCTASWRRPSDLEASQLRVVGRCRAPRYEERLCQAVVELAFRGSANMENWLTNCTAGLTGTQVGGLRECGKVHSGWQDAYLSLREEMLATMDASLASLGVEPLGQTILAWVTGHSLGGALATLAAYDLASSRGYNVRCVLWASPRIGDAEFVTAYQSAVPRTARFVNKFDFVSRLPISPGDDNGDAAVLNEMALSVLGSVLAAPHMVFGASGYRHVCRGVMLDPQADRGTWLAPSAAAASRGRGITAMLSLFKWAHDLSTYEANLEEAISRVAGGETGGGNQRAEHASAPPALLTLPAMPAIPAMLAMPALPALPALPAMPTIPALPALPVPSQPEPSPTEQAGLNSDGLWLGPRPLSTA